MHFVYLFISCALVSEADYQDRIDSLDRFDLDGDGFRSSEDCDDNDPTVPVRWYRDEDGDGFGSDLDMLIDCGTPEGYVENNQDCDDSSSDQTPLDGDGDGASSCDGDCDDENELLNIVDADGDGFSTCALDCDDTDFSLTPNDADGDGVSTCDGDCNDGDATLTIQDVDGDGVTSCDGDCDDSDSRLNLLDLDGDGYSSCDGDCDEQNPYIHPGKLELSYDGIDQDCDGIDESTTLPSWNVTYVTDNAQASIYMNNNETMFFSWNNVESQIAILYREDISSTQAWVIQSLVSPREEIPAFDGDVQNIRMINQESGVFAAFTEGGASESSWAYRRHNTMDELFDDIVGRTGIEDFTAYQTPSNELRVSFIYDVLSFEQTEWYYYESTNMNDIVSYLNDYQFCDARIISIEGYYRLFAR